jgi:Tfp pilus assembly protein PilV
MDMLVTFRTFFRNVARDEDGLTLIEVVITTLFVALIVVGTLTGFQDINRVSADERFHDEAAMLAAQSQDQLRSDPASVLDALEGASEHRHSYTAKVDGNLYTIAQEATYIDESKSGSDCLATAASESTKNEGDYLRVTSRVTWPQLKATGREAVSESSIITPPDGSALEIDATNGSSPESAVSGVTSVVKYTGVESAEPTTIEGTTGTAGCVVFGGIPATSAKVEIKEVPGYVTTSGAVKVPAKEVTIAPNITTHDQVVLNEGGAITTKFKYGSTEVEGNTFVAYFPEVTKPTSEFTVGSIEPEFESGGEHKYKANTEKYAKSITTPMNATSYSKGDLFPFPTTKKEWVVFAGDCPENNAHTIDSSVSDGEAVVTRGETSTTSVVPMTDLVLNVYTGTSAAEEALATTAYEVKITNTACEKSSIPINTSAANLIHKQTTKGGHLEHAYQPFGKEKLCLYNATEKHTYTVEPDLTTTTAHEDTIYLKQKVETYTSPGSSDPVTVATASSC